MKFVEWYRSKTVYEKTMINVKVTVVVVLLNLFLQFVALPMKRSAQELGQRDAERCERREHARD